MRVRLLAQIALDQLVELWHRFRVCEHEPLELHLAETVLCRDAEHDGDAMERPGPQRLKRRHRLGDAPRCRAAVDARLVAVVGGERPRVVDD
eukprot:4141393-Prymnesium_polylepis.2